jgi:hypothetical protein
MALDPADAGNPPIGNSPPADDLRSLIAGITRESAASSESGGSPGPAASEGGPAPRPAASEGEPPPKEPLRPPGEGAGEPGPGEGQEGGEPQKPLVPPAPGEPEPAPRDGKDATAPEHWSAADKAIHASWPQEVRRQTLAWYKRMEGGFTQRLQRGSYLEKEFGDLDQIFIPEQREMLTAQNRTPKDVIRIWHQVELGLMRPEFQNELIARMIHNYRADPGRIAGILNQLRGFSADPTGRTSQPNGGGGGELPPASHGAGNGYATAPQIGNGVDPASGVHPTLARRLDALEVDRAQRIDADNAARLQAANREIETFAAEKDSEGYLAHPFFAELQDEMMGFARADQLAGRTPILKDLYDRAVWANAGTRDRALASQREAEDRQAAADRKAKADAARRAGSSITGAPTSGQLPNSGQPDGRSIRDEIRAQMSVGNRGGRV